MLKFRNLTFLIAFIFVFVAFTACSGQNDDGKGMGGDEMAGKAGYSDISPDTAKERLDSDEEVILLDVRTKEEYDTVHIKNSVLIPLDELEAIAPEVIKDKATPIFVYCRSGNRSITASEILVKLGYTNVYNLGGINDWPYEVED